MKKSGWLLALPLALGFAAGGASAANLVQNGDFNSPGAASAQLLSFGSTFVTNWLNEDQYTGYIPMGQSADQTWQCCLLGSAGPGYGVDNGLVGPPSGNASLVIDGTNGFGPGGGYGYVSQSISGLVAGQTYVLSFWQAGSQEYSVGGDTVQMFDVSLGDQTWTSPAMNVPSQGFAPWAEVSATFTWDGVGDTLQFMSVGTGDPAFAMLADVSLTTGAVPEPATWAMIVAGFAGIGFAARARSRKAAAVAA